MFLTLFFTYLHTENTVRNITKINQIISFGLSKKAAVVSNFCLTDRLGGKEAWRPTHFS